MLQRKGRRLELTQMHRIVTRTHDCLGLLFDFHWREATRHDWRSGQIELIDECIFAGINSLGINTLAIKGGRGEPPEGFAGHGGVSGKAAGR